ncbi:MAG: hypothetical protein R3B99_19315 [Polyangiales bacterium]
MPANEAFSPLRNDPAARSAYLVEVLEIRADERDPAAHLRPRHPDADERAWSRFRTSEVVEEMVNMIMASRAYEAVTLLQTIMYGSSALDIGG